eukprot:COSAG02_NODE_7433_length_3015_cov_4.222565_1_plen_69_part_00
MEQTWCCGYLYVPHRQVCCGLQCYSYSNGNNNKLDLGRVLGPELRSTAPAANPGAQVVERVHRWCIAR